VRPAKAVRACDHHERRQREPACATRDDPRTAHEKDRGCDIREVVYHVVEQRAVEHRDSLADAELACERPIARIDRDRNRHHDEGRAKVIVGDIVKCEQTGDRAERSVEMHRPCTSLEKFLTRHRLRGGFYLPTSGFRSRGPKCSSSTVMKGPHARRFFTYASASLSDIPQFA